MVDRSSIALLRRIARACRDGGPLDPADAAELAARLERYEAGADSGVSLDDAFGVATAPGSRPWWTAERRRRRDAALREAAHMLRPGASIAEQAAVLAEKARRYEVTAWRWDRRSASPPATYVGTWRGPLFAAFTAGPVPLGLSQLRAILAADELAEDIGSDPCESSGRSGSNFP